MASRPSTSVFSLLSTVYRLLLADRRSPFTSGLCAFPCFPPFTVYCLLVFRADFPLFPAAFHRLPFTDYRLLPALRFSLPSRIPYFVIRYSAFDIRYSSFL
jgi:hypothetical protein